MIPAMAAVGFYGKIPSRGDFVRAGLPGDFVAAWDAWLQTVIAAARESLASAWDPAWLEAPVWRFSLPPGQCGAAGVLGLWMPSVDAAGRHFPLTLAAVSPAAVPAEADAWLDGAEQAGRDALEADLSPVDLAARIPACALVAAGAGDDGLARWWTDGSPYVPAGSFRLMALPDAACFTAMVWAAGETAPAASDGAS